MSTLDKDLVFYKFFRAVVSEADHDNFSEDRFVTNGEVLSTLQFLKFIQRVTQSKISSVVRLHSAD